MKKGLRRGARGLSSCWCSALCPSRIRTSHLPRVPARAPRPVEAMHALVRAGAHRLTVRQWGIPPLPLIDKQVVNDLGAAILAADAAGQAVCEALDGSVAVPVEETQQGPKVSDSVRLDQHGADVEASEGKTAQHLSLMPFDICGARGWGSGFGSTASPRNPRCSLRCSKCLGPHLWRAGRSSQSSALRAPLAPRRTRPLSRRRRRRRRRRD